MITKTTKTKVKLNRQIEVALSILNSGEKEFLLFRSKAEENTADIFDVKRALFNPIYVSNICLADCPYCGYRISNKRLPRKTLKPNETIKEAEFLKERNVDNILVLAGDYRHDKYVEMLTQNISAIKESVNPKWLGIEVATLDQQEYELLKMSGVESVTVFQETYNRLRYNKLHTNVEYKGDFDYRYNSLERAVKAGFEEIGLGVLYGVGFWKEDTISMIEHASLLKEKYPNVQLRFSFPRLQISTGQDESCETEKVTDEELAKAIVAVRTIFPSANLVLTGREDSDFLIELLSIVNIVGYDGSTKVGGYKTYKDGLKQFELQRKVSFSKFLAQMENSNYDCN